LACERGFGIVNVSTFVVLDGLKLCHTLVVIDLGGVFEKGSGEAGGRRVLADTVSQEFLGIEGCRCNQWVCLGNHMMQLRAERGGNCSSSFSSTEMSSSSEKEPPIDSLFD